eukprot:12026560-Alexandrium_andersonii.AAC.1
MTAPGAVLGRRGPSNPGSKGVVGATPRSKVPVQRAAPKDVAPRPAFRRPARARWEVTIVLAEHDFDPSLREGGT